MPDIDVFKERLRLGETQDEFARRFGVDQGTISRWEQNGLPKHGVTRAFVEKVLADIHRKKPKRNGSQ